MASLTALSEQSDRIKRRLLLCGVAFLSCVAAIACGKLKMDDRRGSETQAVPTNDGIGSSSPGASGEGSGTSDSAPSDPGSGDSGSNGLGQ